MKYEKKVLCSVLIGLLAFSNISLGFANEIQRYEPKEKTVNGITYLDGIPLYSNEDIDSGKVHDDLLNNYKTPLFRASSSTKYDEWVLIGENTIYNSKDYDRYNNNSSSSVSRSLTTTSKTYYEVSGEVNFKSFKAIAESKIGGRIGKEWGKTVTNSYLVPKKTVAEQKTACRVPVYSYKYTVKTYSGNKSYYADAYGNKGVETWYYTSKL